MECLSCFLWFVCSSYGLTSSESSGVLSCLAKEQRSYGPIGGPPEGELAAVGIHRTAGRGRKKLKQRKKVGSEYRAVKEHDTQSDAQRKTLPGCDLTDGVLGGESARAACSCDSVAQFFSLHLFCQKNSLTAAPQWKHSERCFRPTNKQTNKQITKYLPQTRRS